MQPRHKSTKLISKAKLTKRSSFLGYVKAIEEFLGENMIDHDVAIDNITYGIPAEKPKDGYLCKTIVVLSGNDSNIIEIIDPKSKSIEKINLLKIINVSFESDRGEFLKLKKNCLQASNKNFVNLMSTGSTDLVFESNYFLNVFLHSILILTQSEKLQELDLVENLKRAWQKYDKDFSGKMEIEEFKSFVKDLNMNIKKVGSAEELFKIIDKDCSNFIDFKEFIEYYDKLNSGVEFEDIFMKYSKSKDFMSPYDLKEFFTEEQEEFINEEEAAQIMATINSSQTFSTLNNDEDYSLKVTLPQFKKLMYDRAYTTVYDVDKIYTMQNMDKPLYNYFINSSHNTYLTGNQFNSKSDVEMYSYALLQGYRLVELDCYDGTETDGPRITHGYTLCSDILLKDVLTAMRKSAFVNSDYPVLLSIENHLSAKQQNIMGEMFKSILIDIFVLDDKDIPHDYPSPNELKGKFVVKCGRPRIYGDPEAKTKNKTGTLISSSRNANAKGSYAFIKVSDNKGINNVEDKGKTQTNSAVKKSFWGEKKQKVIENTKEIDVVLQKLSSKAEEMNDAKIEENAVNQKKKSDTVTGSSLVTAIGLIGTKFHIEKMEEMHYQSWDCVTLKESKINKWAKNYETRKQLMQYSSGSFMKSYPLNLNSANLDPTKTWLCGAQIAAINIQTLTDDFTLLNQVFFKMNNNCGYILKPEKYLNHNSPDKYNSPKGKLTIQIISGMNLHLLFTETVNTRKDVVYSIKAFIKGSFEDDANNKEYELKISHNFLNPIFGNEAIFEFDVYEEYLSSIYFRMTIDSKLKGRCVMPLSLISKGIRTVPVYDNLCKELNDTFFVVKIIKTF